MKKDFFKDSKIKFPAYEPWISRDDEKFISKTLKQSMLTLGPQLEKFESDFCKYSKAKYAIAVSNCTAALHLSLKALGIKKNDEVIIPDLTFVATANAVLFTGATPVIADIDKNNFNISVQSIENSITKKTKAIIPVHFAGSPCDMGNIRKLAKKYDLKIVEDCAHAIGAKIKNKHVGTFGDTGCFSFYPTKNLTTFEGGMIITNSRKIANKMISLRNHGISKSLANRFTKGKPWEYEVTEPGYNYRLDEIRAALGISQLKRINQNNLKRKKAFLYYNSKIGNNKNFILPKILKNQTHACHLYVLRIQKNKKFSRDSLFRKLLGKGIRSSVHYKPLHQFSAYKKNGKIIDKLTVSKSIYKEIISLPLYPQIERKQQDLVIQNLQ